LEKQVQVRQKVKAAFAYPLVVTGLSLAVIGFLLVFVIPVFSKLYQQVNAPLPGPTLALVAASAILRNWWWLLLVLVGGGIAGARRALKRPRVRAFWDDLKLNLPVFGRLNQMLVVCHFLRTFAMLASVGVPFVKALEMAGLVANNYRMGEVTKDLQRTIESGSPLTESLKRHGIFPPIVVQLAASGEEVGELPEMLNRGADLLDRDVDRLVASLMVKLEPVLTLLMGTVVGFVLMGAYLPMFDYIGHLK
jgi:type II secretory pathway component PulF